MQRLQIAGGLAAMLLALADAPNVPDGTPEPIAVKQEKTENTAKFEGRWNVVSGTVDGDPQDLQGAKVHLAKGKFTLTEQNGDEQVATYEADTSKKPTRIDFTSKQGKDKDKIFKGILILEGNQLKLCLARPGDDRPTEASSEEGSGHLLLVLEPAKSEPATEKK